MGSLKKCLDAAGLGRHERAILRGRIEDVLDEGYDEHQAAVRAVRAYIKELEDERSDVHAQLREAGVPQKEIDNATTTRERKGIGSIEHPRVPQGENLREDEAEVREETGRRPGRGRSTERGTEELTPEEATFKGEAFEQGQVKSATGNTGAFDPRNPNILLSRWYSQLRRVAEAAPMKSAPGAEWSKYLASRPGVKPDEIHWTGINEWLQLQPGKVSREQVTQYLDQNGVQVQDVTLQDTMPPELSRHMASVAAVPTTAVEWTEKSESFEREARRWQKNGDEEKADRFFQLAEQANTMAEQMDTDAGVAVGATKFSQYQLPGGKNYRELLLTLPWRSGSAMRDAGRRLQDAMAAERAVGVDVINRGDLTDETDAARAALERERALQAEKTFRSPHFNQPNILAHVRFNERTDTNGRKILFLEELQSDWAQKGKKEGFLGPIPTELPDGVRIQKNPYGNEWRGVKANGDPITGWHVSEEAAKTGTLRVLAGSEYTEGRETGHPRKPPAAPFVAKTEAWLGLALKRMIRYAAVNGYDAVAWTTGAQQAERYKLSKHVDRIDVTPRTHGETGEKTRGVRIWFKDDNVLELGVDANGVVDNVGRAQGFVEVMGKPLADVIGKEMAERIMASDKATFDGDGLDVGGSGMTAFYDRIVPNVANDVLKKLSGGKVENVALEIDGEASQQQGFSITPELRDLAMAGLPLFSRGAESTGITRAQLDAVVESISLGWKNPPPVIVHDSINDAPGPVQDTIREQKAELEVEAAYYDGELHMFPHNITDVERAQYVFMHESVHRGLAGILGDEKPAVMRSIYDTNKSVRSLADAKIAADGIEVERAVEEVLAEMAEIPPSVMDRLIAAVRAFIRKLGWNLGISDREIRTMVLDAIGYNRNPPEHTLPYGQTMLSNREWLELHPAPTGPPNPLFVKLEGIAGAAGRLTRALQRGETIGGPDNPRTELRLGDKKFVYGRITVQDWWDRVQANLTPDEIRRARAWYGDLNRLMSNFFGTDRAPHYALAWLLSQQNTTPSGGMTNVLRAADIARGLPIVKKAGLDTEKLVKAIRGEIPEGGYGAKLLDFVDSELQRGTRSVMGDDPRGGAPDVIDVWANRDIGKVDQRVVEYLRKTFGVKGDEVKIDGKSIGETDYEYGSRWYNNLSAALNAKGIDGGLWRPHEVQAVGWVAMQRQMGAEAEFPEDVFGRNTRRVSIGLAPGEGTPLSELGAEITPVGAYRVVRGAAEMTGVIVRDAEASLGAYLGGTEGALQVDVLGSPESVNDFMDVIGYSLQQTEVIGSRPLKSGKVRGYTLIDQGTLLATPDGAERFMAAVRAKLPESIKVGDREHPIAIANGYQMLTVGGKPAVRIYDGAYIDGRMKWGGNWETSERKLFEEAVHETAKDLGARIGFALNNYVIGSAFNDWGQQPNGEGYTGSLLDRGRVEYLRRLALDDQLRLLPDEIGPAPRRGKIQHPGEGGVFLSRRNLGNLTPDQELAAEHVLGSLPTVGDRIKAFAANWQEATAQGLFDQFAPLAKLGQREYQLARMSKAGEGTLEAAMVYGKPFVTPDGFYDVDYTEKGGFQGFSKVLTALKGEHDRALLWVAAQRAERLKGLGLENLFTDEHIAALKTLDQGRMSDGTPRAPLYRQFAQDLTEWNAAFLKIGRDSGLLSQELEEMLRGQLHLPFYRVAEDASVNGFGGMTPGLVNQYFSRRLKGGPQQLFEDQLSSLLRNWSHIITASARNRAARASYEAGKAAGIVHDVPRGTKGSVRYLDNGVEHAFVVDDPYVMDAITSLEYAGLGAWSRPFTAAKRALSVTVTANPAYKIRNLIRDSIQSVATGDVSYNPLVNIKSGWEDASIRSEVRAHMLAGGGLIRFGTMLDGQTSDPVRRLVDAGVPRDMILDSGSAIEKFWKHTVKPAIDAYQEFGDRGEAVNRIALYKRLLEKGYSHGEAAFWARDLMDFSMSGKWAAIRTLTQLVPFMNARLQGLYKLGRATQQDWQRMAYTLGVVSAASVALMLAYKDDEDWRRRPDWHRDNYWWFKVGDKAFTMPKPFELGAVATIAERVAELLASDEMTGERFARSMRNLVSSQLSMNPIPQLLMPTAEIWANRDSFTGKQIEGMGMEHLRPEDRYTDRTSEVGRFLGRLGLPSPADLAMGSYKPLSPVQIDHLIQGYFAWIGTAALVAMDYGIRPMVDRGERPAMKLKDVFLAGNFVESLPSGSSRYVNDLYEQAREVEQAYGSYRELLKRGEVEQAKLYAEEHREELLKHKLITPVRTKMAEYNREAKLISADRSKTAEEKRVQLDRLAEMKDTLARRFSERSTQERSTQRSQR